jgi:hypothetical protein
MTSHFYAAKQLTEKNALISAPTEASDKPDSLWQCMLHSWIRTYELSSSSGTVPFLIL